MAECPACVLGKAMALAGAATGPVTHLVLRWIGRDGAITDLAAEAQGDSLIMTPPAGIKPGTQFVSWRAVSADGHGVGGTHSFCIGTATELADATDASASVAARAILTLSLAIALGAVLAPGLITATPPHRVLRQGGLVAVALGSVAGLALVAAEGLALVSLPRPVRCSRLRRGGPFRPHPWSRPLR